MYHMRTKAIIVLGFFAFAFLPQTLISTTMPQDERTLFDPIPLVVQPSCTKRSQEPQKRKPWTFVVYMAADNDMHNFASLNIRQMAHAGSNEQVNLLVHLNIKLSGNKKITRHYYIEHEQVVCVNYQENSPPGMDTGNPKTLYSCCKWAIEDYPADNYAIIIWNHGSGCLEPATGNRVVEPAELFNTQRSEEQFSLRSPFRCPSTQWYDQKEEAVRGVCWDSSTGNYLTNKDLSATLKRVQNELLGGKKINLLGFDVCLMAMVEIACEVREHANLMIASEDNIWGPGWNYARILKPFTQNAIPKAEELAKTIVYEYAATYGPITQEYCLSAIKLDQFETLEHNISQVATLLLDIGEQSTHNSVFNALKASVNKMVCTHFDTPSFIDLHHFYQNLSTNLGRIQLSPTSEAYGLLTQLKRALSEGTQLISQLVIANTAGRSLSKAKGISIYFPTHTLHPGYDRSRFAKTNNWMNLLRYYLRRKHTRDEAISS